MKFKGIASLLYLLPMFSLAELLVFDQTLFYAAFALSGKDKTLNMRAR